MESRHQDQDSAPNKKQGLDLVIPTIDGRSAFFKRRSRLTIRILGDISNPTDKQKDIAERAAVLLMGLEDAEAAMASGAAVDLGQYSTACNTFRRLLEALHGTPRRKREKSVDELLWETKMKFEAHRDTAEAIQRRANAPKPDWLNAVLARSRMPRSK